MNKVIIAMAIVVGSCGFTPHFHPIRVHHTPIHVRHTPVSRPVAQKPVTRPMPKPIKTKANNAKVGTRIPKMSTYRHVPNYHQYPYYHNNLLMYWLMFSAVNHHHSERKNDIPLCFNSATNSYNSIIMEEK